MGDLIAYDVADGVAHLGLNRPDAANAFDLQPLEGSGRRQEKDQVPLSNSSSHNETSPTDRPGRDEMRPVDFDVVTSDVPAPLASVLSVRGRSLTVSGTLVMGVVNASPESFSDGGRFANVNERIEFCAELVEAGADIVDIGGQSAITNQPELDAGVEIDRVMPLVEWLHRSHPDVLVSVDTYKPAVVEATLAAGASIINDVSGLRYPEIVDSCAQHQAALVLMHTRAAPKVRLQDADLYRDVTSDVVEFLRQRIDAVARAGLNPQSLIVDPGPDFTKTPAQTVSMLRRLDEVRAFGRPVLLALSRKDFLGAITGRPPLGREAATHAALAYFVSTPGNIVRVHDVRAARDVIATVETLAGLRDIEDDYLLPEALRHERPGV
jgi:dihydropteroate synthase